VRFGREPKGVVAFALLSIRARVAVRGGGDSGSVCRTRRLHSCSGCPHFRVMASNTCNFVVGRLLEIRVAAGYRSVTDVDGMIGMMQGQVSRLPVDDKYSIAADWRAVHIMSPETSTRARAMMAKSNPRVTRSAILTLPEESTTNLQVLRIVREAENAARRHFTTAPEMHRWLSEVLTTQEARRLASFLGLAP